MHIHPQAPTNILILPVDSTRWGSGRLLLSPAGGPPRSATGDTATAGKTHRSTVAKSVNPPLIENQTGPAGHYQSEPRLSLSGIALTRQNRVSQTKRFAVASAHVRRKPDPAPISG